MHSIRKTIREAKQLACHSEQSNGIAGIQNTVMGHCSIPIEDHKSFLKRFWLALEHYTNSAHVLCRFMTLLKYYEKLWTFIFIRNAPLEQRIVITILRKSKEPYLERSKPMLPLHNGDLFATANPSAVLGRGINWIQKWNSRDNESKYSHAGVIINPQGGIIESLWRVSLGNLYRRYSGKQIIVARCNSLSDEQWEAAFLLLSDHLGMYYPWWRLPLHVIPPLAKYLSFTGMPVCSELVAKVEHRMGARHRWWTGTCPDTLVEEWKHWKNFDIVFEGVL